MDMRRNLNFRYSFPGRKFKNQAQIGCSPGSVLSSISISFELHANTAEEIDLEKCNIRNFGSYMTLTLILDRVEVTLLHIRGRGLPTDQITVGRNRKKNFLWMYGRTDTPDFQSTRSSPGDDLKTKTN